MFYPGKAEMETYIQQLESQKTRLEKEVSDLEVIVKLIVISQHCRQETG